MPLDSKTHRNLGYSFIQFTSVDDLITAYEHVWIDDDDDDDNDNDNENHG